MSAGRGGPRSTPLPLGLAPGVILFAVWAIGQLFRDRTLLTAWAFYLPSALVLGALVLLAAVAALRRRGRRAGALLLLALLPAAVIVLLENSWQSRATVSTRAADLRVVAWNVADFPRGVERAAAVLRPLHADLVLLSEAPGKPPQELERLLGGGLHLTPIGAMALFVRGDLLDVEWLAREDQLQMALVRCRTSGRTLSVLAVNVISSPRVPRDPLLARIVEIVEQRGPDLVLGDFNAPRRSRALTRLPAGFRHAYDAGGSGWSSTWPAELPLLAIDQTIVGPHLAVRGYSLHTTRISDHRLQLTELDFAVPPEGGSG